MTGRSCVELGVKRIFTICKNYGIILPQINTKPNSFEVVLFKEKLNEGINEDLDKLYNYIRTHPNKRISYIEKEMKVNYKTFERWIKTLKNDDLIIYIGSKKTGGYFMKK